MVTPILFPHIPKSAGTSFRNAFEQQFGFYNVLRDYSPAAKETSIEVVNAVYKKKDLFQLKNNLDSGQFSMIAGHFPAIKYARLLPIENMVTFVREPISRLISEYKHFQRHFDYKKSLLKFVEENRNINVQHRMLQQVPISSIGLIGITEYYEESLQIFNDQFKLNIPALINNISPNKTEHNAVINDDIIQRIRILNQRDIELYNEVIFLHKKRLALQQQKLVYTYGQFQLQNKRLVGWAFQKDNNKAITLDICWHNKKQQEVVVSEYNMLMDSFNCPRNGYIAFNIPLPSNVDLLTLDCVVKNTQQSLVNKIT